jgi:hypothetical protein
MRVPVGIAVSLLIGSAAQAVEPPARAASPAQATTPASRSARQPLKLGIGDVRKYMMPNEFRAAVSSDSDRATIVVEGDRSTAPLKSTQPLPQGLGAVYSVFRYPASAWRMFLPDPRGVPPGPPDVVPAREFRWGP